MFDTCTPSWIWPSAGSTDEEFRIVLLEQELQDKVRLLVNAQQQELVRSSHEHKQRMEAELREKEAMVVRREKAVSNVTEGGEGQGEAQVKVNI